MAKGPRTPKPPRAQEREMGKLTRHIVEQVAKRWENNVLKMPQYQARKFEDANWQRATAKKEREVRRMVMKQLSNDRIQKQVEKIMRRADNHNKKTLYGELTNAMGINTAQLMRDGTSVKTQALIDATAQWVQSLRDKTLQQMTDTTLAAMAEGQTLDQVTDAVVAQKAKSSKHATFLARNEIGRYTGLMTKIRTERLGITRAVWDTSDDESVRPSHAARDGREYNQEDGLYSSVDGEYLIPGVDYNCRCVARLVIDDDAGK